MRLRPSSAFQLTVRVIAKIRALSLRFGYCRQGPENSGIVLLQPGGDRVKFAVQFASKSVYDCDDSDGNSRGHEAEFDRCCPGIVLQKAHKQVLRGNGKVRALRRS